MRPLGAFVLLLALVPSAADSRCLKYEPTTVSLAGRLASKTVPGPPSYVSIARGDVPETIYILHLDTPVCVLGDPSSRLNAKSHAGVKEIQLVTPGTKARSLLGKRVNASGTLFGSHTRHHRTPVLLRTSRLDGA
jgi:hypothetical protein